MQQSDKIQDKSKEILNSQVVNMDAWSDGQMRSKIWLCQELEAHWSMRDDAACIWIFGAWYGTLAQFLLVREKIKIKNFGLFDVDSQAVDISKQMTTMWWLNKKVSFDFYVQNCDFVSPDLFREKKPDLVINTSCEHFSSYDWFKNLPMGQKFLVQSTNMKHPTHILCPTSLEQFKESLGSIASVTYQGVLAFRYPHFHFDRYMVIGTK